MQFEFLIVPVGGARATSISQKRPVIGAIAYGNIARATTPSYIATTVSVRSSDDDYGAVRRLYGFEYAAQSWILKRPSARSGPGTVSEDRNVRSKCRCSSVLQFTI